MAIILIFQRPLESVSKPMPLPVGGGIIGRLDEAIAARLGIEGGVSVVNGGYDRASAALGGGVIEPLFRTISEAGSVRIGGYCRHLPTCFYFISA